MRLWPRAMPFDAATTSYDLPEVDCIAIDRRAPYLFLRSSHVEFSN